MAIAHLATAPVNNVINGLTNTLDLTLITGLAQGDIVLAFCASSAGTQATPSGYTNLHTHAVSGLQANLSYKIQTSSVDTSISFWDTGGSGDAGVAFARAFRGVDTADPFAATTIEASGTTTTPDCGAITPAVDNAAIVLFAAMTGNDSPTHPANYTTLADDEIGSDTNDISGASNFRILSGGGGASENPAAYGSWVPTAQWVAYTVALRPGPEGQPFYLRESSIESAWNGPWTGGWKLG